MKINIDKNFLFKRILPVLGGAVLGYLYYYFIGCNGSCPISGSPYISTLYGAGLGLLWALPLSSKKGIKDETNN